MEITLNHLAMKEVIREIGLVNSFDYIRSVNEHGWTDFNLNTANKILDKKNSKYVITSTYQISPNKHANILYIPSLQELLFEMQVEIKKNKDFPGYDKDRKRLFGHFIDENIIVFGNKTDKHIEVELKAATLPELFNKNNYSLEMTHNEIQWHLIILGLALGLSVKVARNDRSQVIKGNILSDIATLNVEDLPLPDLAYEYYKESKNIIDLIDVIWADKRSNKIVCAFEVELSGNIKPAILRLVELKYHQSNIKSIIVGRIEDLHTTARYGSLLAMRDNMKRLDLQYLTLQDLVEAIIFNNKFGGKNNGLWQFFFNSLLKRVNEHGAILLH